MELIYYDLIQIDEMVFGSFSTYEKAEEFKQKLEGLDGYGIIEEDLHIAKHVIKLDEVSDEVLEFIEKCKFRKMKDLEEES